MLLCAILKNPRLIERLEAEYLTALPDALRGLFFQLTALLAEHTELTPHTLSSRLFLPNDPMFLTAFVAAAKAAEKLEYIEAERMVDGYVDLEKRKKENAMLLKAQDTMQRLSRAGEFGQAKALLLSQTESLRLRRPRTKEVEQRSKATSLLAPPTTPDYTVPTDLPEDDGGWL